MKWYIPSWNGDLRLTPSAKNDDHTTLTIHQPTLAERQLLVQMGRAFEKRGWVPSWKDPKPQKLFGRPTKIELRAPLDEVGPVVSKIMRPGKAVLTAITFIDGRVETCSGSEADLAELAKGATAAPEDSAPRAAATIKRPTPSCPQCIPGAILPASEVLLTFLSPEQHASWARTRSIVVTGGLSKHRYIIAHRHSPIARRFGRICYDFDSNMVVHFHDWTVPPEEEVLAAKLILEHREPWLRNEATMLLDFGILDTCGVQRIVQRDLRDRQPVYKNPFGDVMDGVADANMARRVGEAALRLFGSGIQGPPEQKATPSTVAPKEVP
jgi:hypothetical protein